MVRMSSTTNLDLELTLKALDLGADGVMIWEVEERHDAELVEEVKEELVCMGVEPERVEFRLMAPIFFKALLKFITCFVDQVKKLGKISDENREKILT